VVLRFEKPFIIFLFVLCIFLSFCLKYCNYFLIVVFMGQNTMLFDVQIHYVDFIRCFNKVQAIFVWCFDNCMFAINICASKGDMNW
jgi:hypothetical protein